LYDQSKGRPLFLIRDMVGGPGDVSTAAEEPASPLLATVASAPSTPPAQLSG
jgi:hypothetical protein